MVGRVSLADGIQKGFTEGVTFTKLSKLENIGRWIGRWGKAREEESVAWSSGAFPAPSDSQA